MQFIKKIINWIGLLSFINFCLLNITWSADPYGVVKPPSVVGELYDIPITYGVNVGYINKIADLKRAFDSVGRIGYDFSRVNNISKLRQDSIIKIKHSFRNLEYDIKYLMSEMSKI